MVVASTTYAQTGWKPLNIEVGDMTFSSPNQGYLLYDVGDTESYISNDFDSVINNSVFLSGKPNPNYGLGQYPSSVWSLSDTSAITLGHSIYRRTFSSWAETTSDQGVSWKYLGEVRNFEGKGLKLLKVNDTAFFLLTGDSYDDDVWIKQGTLYRTSAVGKNWDSKLWVRGVQQSFKDIIFVDSITGLCIGDSIVFVTTDLGDTWDTLSIQLNDGRRGTSCQSMANVKGTNRLFAGSKYGMIATNDKGKSWYISDSSILRVTAISFFDSLIGYCAISSGYINGNVYQETSILKTLDGGQTWGKQYVSKNNSLGYRKFVIASKQRTFALSYWGSLYMYDGGGSSLSVNENKNILCASSYITCYPNSTNQRIEVYCPLNEGSRVYIYDDLGRVLLQQDRYSTTANISIMNIKSGHYTVKIGQKYGRFIVQH